MENKLCDSMGSLTIIKTLKIKSYDIRNSKPGSKDDSSRSHKQHGHVHLCLREFVIETYGPEAWERVLKEAELDDDNDFMLFHYYPDANTFKMVGSIQNNVGITLPELLEEYGKHFYAYASKRGYDRMMRTLGRDFYSFVQNLDLLHSLLALTYKGLRPPQFRCERKEGKLYVHVYTVRPAMYPVAIGTLKEVAKQIFNTDIEMKVVERKTGDIFESKYCEHVILEVEVIGEDKGVGVIERKPQRYSVVIDTGVKKDVVNKNDNQTVALPKRSLHLAIPYSVIFDDRMQIRGAGLNLKTLCADLEKPNIKLNDVFEIKEPSVKLTYKNIMNCSTSYMYFFLQLKAKKESEEDADCPVLRGHMVPLEDKKQIAFLGSPYFESISDLLSSQRFLHNIPQDQITMEIMFMNEQRSADVEMSKKLDETTATMKKLAAALDEEKKKTDALLYEMLPFKVANQLREGKTVQAEKHECVTILFSDIVTFTNMAAKCEPIQIVALLNDLFMRFDQLSTKHDVYKVETIGDAYMVVAGVPETINDHAQRVTNMGLDMMSETNKVLSPVTSKPIQIRVGMHTGPVVSGVVGTRMPRYCLFGDTVNTASRMESHGVPGRVHISNTTYEKLSSAEYDIEPRGGIEIKGKGIMQTYFVNQILINQEDGTSVSRLDINDASVLPNETDIDDCDRETKMATESVDDVKDGNSDDVKSVGGEETKLVAITTSEPGSPGSSDQSGANPVNSNSNEDVGTTNVVMEIVPADSEGNGKQYKEGNSFVCRIL